MEIKLQNGYSTIIDDEDWNKISEYNWYAKVDKSGVYVAANVYQNRKGQTLRLHRFLLSAPDKVFVDHINGNTLDNRKENLRLCNNSQNTKNRKRITRTKISSKYKGVFHWKKKWKAQICVDGKLIFLGCYNNEEDAAQTYNLAAIKYHEEFAALNVLPDWYDLSSIPVCETKRKYGNNKCVYYEARRNKWFAVANIDGKRKRTKYCNTEEEAVVLRKQLLNGVNHASI